MIQHKFYQSHHPSSSLNLSTLPLLNSRATLVNSASAAIRVQPQRQRKFSPSGNTSFSLSGNASSASRITTNRPVEHDSKEVVFLGCRLKIAIALSILYQLSSVFILSCQSGVG